MSPLIRLSILCLVIHTASLGTVPSWHCDPYRDEREGTAASIRADIDRGHFDSAAEKLGRLHAGSVAGDRELLTLRGLAEWGRALQKAGSVNLSATRYKLIRNAYVSLLALKDKPSNDPSFQRELEAGLNLASGDLAQCKRLCGSFVEACGTVDSELAAAEADFRHASSQPQHSDDKWGEASECWEAMVKVHRLLLLQERSSWTETVALNRPGDINLNGDLPSVSARTLAEADKDAIHAIDSLLKRVDSQPNAATVAHVAADAILLYSAASHRLDDWLGRSRTSRLMSSNQSPSEAEDQGVHLENRKVIHTSDLSDKWNSSPLATALSLYAFAANHGTDSSPGRARYSAYAASLSMPQSDTPVRLEPLNTFTNWPSLLHVERARQQSRIKASQASALAETMRACSFARFNRPVLSAIPDPIRKVFVRSSTRLVSDFGPAIGAGCEPICKFLRNLELDASSPTQRAQLDIARIRFAQLLVKSDLPWDRLLGYKEASAAFSRLAELSDSIPQPERATLAALEASMLQQSVSENLPPSAYGIVNGRAFWVQDPFTDQRTKVINPFVVSFPGGLMTKAPNMP